MVLFLRVMVILGTVVLGGAQVDKCPAKCLCFNTTVRCMFLQIQQIPIIPASTTILDLRFNKIRNIAPESIKHLTQLNTLLLNNNHIKKLQDGAFSGLHNLRYLYLYKNRIRFIEKEVFKNLPKLEQLYLHYNDLGSFHKDTFSELTSLERLFLHNNRIHSIPLGAFRNLASLKRLRLDSNALVCDCQLLWLARMVQSKQNRTQVAATCAFPSGLQGKSLTTLTDDEFAEFECKGMPEILEEPTDVEVNFGGTAYFSCKVDGDPKPEVVWYHNNEILSDNSRYNVLNDGTLMIENAQKDDMGYYECVAKNKMGEAVSKQAQILMADEPYIEAGTPPRIFTRPNDIEVRLGAQLNLDCQFVGSPFPQFSWFKDNVPLSNDIKYENRENGSLYISSVGRDDGGKYTCQVANHLGRDSASATVKIIASPKLIEEPENQFSSEAGIAVFTCRAEGNPAPVISWYRGASRIRQNARYKIYIGGTRLRIQDVKFSDEGEIICRAENSAGTTEKRVKLYVRDKIEPVITQAPTNQNLTEGENATVICKANGLPRPHLGWRRDNRYLDVSGDKFRTNVIGDSTSVTGTLVIYNVTKKDSGKYKCLATNYIGFTTAEATVQVNDKVESFIGDKFFDESFKEAKERVRSAINDTVSKLFNKTRTAPPNPAELQKIFRFPQSTARDLAQAAETVEQTLNIVYEHIRRGQQFNLTDFSYEDILSPRKLRLLTDLSGCLIHRRPVSSCDDHCFNKKYRTMDGSCNNMIHPMWGAALTSFRRELKPIYENGFTTPVGHDSRKRYFGYKKPSPRLVSSKVLGSSSVTSDTICTHMLMQWGQFLDHDIDHALPAVSTESFSTGIPCHLTCDNSPPCLPIEIPPGDPRIDSRRCMEFIRSSAICGSGMTSVFFNKVLPREQINQLTSYIDASQVYSSSDPELQVLRDRTGRNGQMRRGIATPAARYLLPFSNGAPIDCRKNHSESAIDCFLGGDVRANEQLGLLSMHTLFFREHNRIAEEFESINPHWDSDTIFHETRKILGAFMQHITYNHWLPHIIGPGGMKKLENFTKYDPTIDASISNVFATAAFRFGHTLINPVLSRLNATFHDIEQGPLPLHKAFFSPWRIVEEGGIDPILRGLFTSPAKSKKHGEYINAELTEKLFHSAHDIALDLAAINIQRGRDHALDGYTKWREHCGLSVPSTFDEMSSYIKSPDVLTELQRLYGHPGNIDLFVGGLIEDPIDGGRVGPTFSCLLIDQFRRLRDGDRFWYKNPWVFKPEQLSQIEQVTLGLIMCNNGDDITDVTANAFILPSLQKPHFESCENMPIVDLRMWAECCKDCRNAGFFSSLSHPLGTRFRRNAQFSYIEDKEDEVYLNKKYGSLNKSHSEEHPKKIDARTNVVKKASAKLKVEYPNHDPLEGYDKDIAEERIEGIEAVVEHISNTVDSLLKLVKKLERRLEEKESLVLASKKHKKICRDANGVIRKKGRPWSKDACTKCYCRNKGIKCRVKKNCLNQT